MTAGTATTSATTAAPANAEMSMMFMAIYYGRFPMYFAGEAEISRCVLQKNEHAL